MVPVNTPLLIGNEKKYLEECIETGWISSEGPFIGRFEEGFAKYVGRKYAVAVSNGSVALDIAVTALGLKQGDEVILPTFTIISCAAAIIRAGATPVLVDCNSNDYNINVNLIEEKITPKTKAIMVVHIYGLPCDMDPILKLAEKYNLRIIEDAAEMHGQTYHNKKCGSFGDISTFSFYANKHITTGEGGMVLTDDEHIFERCKSLRNLCFKPEKRFVHDELGWNFRMTNMQAAIGLAQLERIDAIIEKKRWIGEQYNKFFNSIDFFEKPDLENSYAKNIYWVYSLVAKKELNLNTIEFCKKLNEKGVGTRPFFWPMHKQPVFNKMGLFTEENHPVSEYISEHGFYIPSGLGLTQEDIDFVINMFKEVLP